MHILRLPAGIASSEVYTCMYKHAVGQRFCAYTYIEITLSTRSIGGLRGKRFNEAKFFHPTPTGRGTTTHFAYRTTSRK